jgi:hypothetical protein
MSDFGSSGHTDKSAPCPLCPQKRTFVSALSMSAWCHKRASPNRAPSYSPFRRAHVPRALMPPFVAQPFFKGPKMDFRIAPAKSLYVSLKSGMIEPMEHLVKLFPENEADDRERQPSKFHFLSEHAAKDIGRLRIGELTAGDLKRLTDEFLGTRERECNERPNVIAGDRLIGPDRIHEFALQNPDLDLVDVVVLHECSRSKDGRWKRELANVLLDLPLALPVINAGIAFGAADRTVDEMCDAGLFCSVGQVLALQHFAPRTDGPEILNSVDAVDAADGVIERNRILEVAADDLDALVACEFLSDAAARSAHLACLLCAKSGHRFAAKARLRSATPPKRKWSSPLSYRWKRAM